MLVDGTPEPVSLAGNRDHNLVEVPLVARRALTPADLGGVRPAELQPPPADRLVTDHDTALGQHFLDHPQAQRKAEVQPDGMGDHRRWIAVASI